MEFHSICDGCDEYSTPIATLSAFLDWLQPRAATGTIVETVQQALEAGRAAAGGCDAAGDLDRVQRRTLYERRLRGGGIGVAVGNRRRLRRRSHPLHDRRQRPHHHEPALHRPVHRHPDNDRQVPLLGPERQHREHPRPDHHHHTTTAGGCDAAGDLDRLQRQP